MVLMNPYNGISGHEQQKCIFNTAPSSNSSRLFKLEGKEMAELKSLGEYDSQSCGHHPLHVVI